ncbi:hypothetical protein [Sphingobacterium bovistauri]|uniref:Uncharacterized protein n=1 Tax=Sphingobacterium bovistauri TaxID=2781959 RepID=A0ABS7Z981_9SPHI|nr:hypothetical protein [Sphingobacterium bovistauri]MCA5005249.1 hypothetical protein [Sphingobacterium bovistauri]
MAINSKGKRKLLLDNQKYYWYVLDEWGRTEFDGVQIRIIPSNQSFQISYGINQIENRRFLSIHLQKDGAHLRFYCPKFENENNIMTNHGIKNILLWCRNTIENKSHQIVPNLYPTSKNENSIEFIDNVFEELIKTIK